jgi:hypothetical protein
MKLSSVRLLVVMIGSLWWSAWTLAQPPTQGNAGARAPITADDYRARLQVAARELRRMEARPPRRLDKVLAPLAKDFTVKSADGQTQSTSGEGWQRYIDNASPGSPNSPSPPNITPTATRQEVQQARRAVEQALAALDHWQRNPGDFVPATNAPQIIQQLENTGQIRTGPTASQQFWANVMKSVADAWENFMKWLGGLFPTPNTGNVQAPNIDPNLIRLLFTLTSVALLGVVGFLVWRAIGGRWRLSNAQTQFEFEGEDAELLELPPDELTDRAQRFAAQGNFREALRHLYIALLLYLDKNGVWRYDARRTNWEHIAALRHQVANQSTLAPQMVEKLSDLTRRFDRVRYGNAPCSSDDWNRFLNDVETLRDAMNNSPSKAGVR